VKIEFLPDSGTVAMRAAERIGPSGKEEPMIEDILQREIYHNRISEYLVCLAILAVGIVAEIFREIEGATLDRVHFFS